MTFKNYCRAAHSVLLAWAVLAAPTSALADPYEPVYVIFNYHLDPLGPNPPAAEINYVKHRAAVQWATALSVSAGVKISAESTGPYAEGCVINGHQGDFLSFMPGQHNALGTHLHAHRKLAGFVDYQWQDVGAGDKPPLLAAEVFADQIYYVNQIYLDLGVAATENRLFHGTHVYSSGVMDQLYLGGGIPPFTYPNAFTILGAGRGFYHPYRGDTLGAEDFAGAYVRVPIASGIAGVDQEHGPEGMVYGTLPYLKKDFLLEYLEWRFAQSHGLIDRIWVYGWASHPYQTTPDFLGTDGVPVRETIESLVGWLNEHFVEATSAEGNVIARYATFLEAADRFEQWELTHAGVSSLDGDPAGGPNYQLVATAAALATSFYEDQVASPADVSAHRFEDREDATVRYVAWTDLPPQILDLSSELSGYVLVTDHLGGTSAQPATAINVERDPLVIVAAARGDLNCDGTVNAFDIDPFVLALTAPAAYEAAYPSCEIMLADINEDGEVNAFDIDPFVDALTGE